MSIAAGLMARSALAAPAAAPVSRRRALLTVVPAGEPNAPRAPFAAAVVALLVTGLIGLLVLNTVLGKEAFKLHALQVEGRKLADQEQVLTREVEALRAPAALAAKATAMGMVQAGPPAFLQLPEGTVLGAPVPAAVPVPPGAEAATDAAPEAAPDAAPVPQPAAQAPAEPPAEPEKSEDG